MGSIGLNIGLKALLTSQSALDTIGHNISNANTPGYSRQSLHLSNAPSVRLRGLIQGNGVQADVVTRTVDELLNKRLLQQTSALERLGTRHQSLTSAEALFDNTGGNGIEGLLQNLFSSISSLSAAPDDNILRADAVQSAVSMSSRFNQVANGLLELGQDTAARVSAHTGQVNVLTAELAELNGQISIAEIDTASANDLRDRRDQILRELSQLVDTRVTENGRGAVRVLVGGQPLVTPTEAHQLNVESDGNGKIVLRIEGSDSTVEVTGGAIGGLMGLLSGFLPRISEELGDYAHNLILEMNRVHSIGIGAGGPFHQLVGSSSVQDKDGDGSLVDELLSNSGLPFDVVSGELYVNVTDESTGEFEKLRIDIDSERTTVKRLLADLNSIAHLNASLDGQGRVQIIADSGFGVDFSPRFDSNPDEIGSLGGGRASLGTGVRGPFALAPGDTLDLTGPNGSFSIAFNTAGFQQIGQATAQEVAAVINSDPGVQANGLVASAVGEDLVLQSVGSGIGESFTVSGGSALASFGWSPGTVVSGQATAVGARFSGTYTGAANESLTFRPNMDGSIGNTPGLRIGVFDANGQKVADLDVGQGYTPGTEIDVLHGVRVSFDLGQVSATDNDVMQLDLVADADTADVLPALGINSLLTGTDAATMGVRADLELDPTLLATSYSGATGDNGTLLKLLDLNESGIGGLGNQTLDEGFAEISGSVAQELNATGSALDAEQFLLDSLEARRDQVSGVNVDEELVKLIEFEQAFAAASQYIRVISDLNQELLSII